MTLTTEQASEALEEIRAAQQRFSVLRGYEFAAPHFFLWGGIWIAGYALSDLYPRWAGLVWAILDPIGIVGSFLIGRATSARLSRADRGYAGRYFAAVATLFGFVCLTYLILQPRSPSQFAAFPALFIGFLYTLIGIWRGARWAIMGLALAALTTIGFLTIAAHFMLWMAFAGGGVLLMSGVWLRRPLS